MLFGKFSILFCSVDVYLFKTAQEKRSAAYFLQSEDEGLVIKHWLSNNCYYSSKITGETIHCAYFLLLFSQVCLSLARLCKRLRSPGIDFKELCSLGAGRFYKYGCRFSGFLNVYEFGLWSIAILCKWRPVVTFCTCDICTDDKRTIQGWVL